MDIGAAGGIPQHWAPYLSLMEIDCFEPDAEECRRRQESAVPSIHWFPVALAGATARRPFYVLNRPTGSSLYPPNEAVLTSFSGPSYAGLRRTIEIECSTVSDFISTHERRAPNLIKLDTQGSELEILASINERDLTSLMMIETEVEFLELYVGQPNFVDIQRHLTSRGFRLLDLRTHRSYRNVDDQPAYYLKQHLQTAVGGPSLSAELVAGDALYIRGLAIASNDVSRVDVLKYVLLCKMYRFYDLAFHTIAWARDAGIISIDEATALVGDVAFAAPSPRLRQRPDVAGQLARGILWAMGHDDHEVFWTRRQWPDQ